MPLDSWTRGHRASKSSLDPKTVDYRTRKRPHMPEITSFDDAASVVYRGDRHRNPPGTRKPWSIAHENGQKCPKSRVLTMTPVSCTGVTGHRNPTGTRKPWTIAHENGQECSKSLVLTMALESCTRGHKASKSSLDPKIMDYIPRKRPEMPEITSFDDAARFMDPGSQGIEILHGSENRGL